MSLDFTASMQRIALLTGPCLAKLESMLSPHLLVAPDSIKPDLDLLLPYPEVLHIQRELEPRGCTPSTAVVLGGIFRDGVEELRESSRANAAQTWIDVETSMNGHTPSRFAIQTALQKALERQCTRTFLEQVALLKSHIFAEVDDDLTQKREAIEIEELTTDVGVIETIKGKHTLEQVRILTEFRDMRLTTGKEVKFKPEERKLIAKATGLSDSQILTWVSFSHLERAALTNPVTRAVFQLSQPKLEARATIRDGQVRLPGPQARLVRLAQVAVPHFGSSPSTAFLLAPSPPPDPNAQILERVYGLTPLNGLVRQFGRRVSCPGIFPSPASVPPFPADNVRLAVRVRATRSLLRLGQLVFLVRLFPRFRYPPTPRNRASRADPPRRLGHSLATHSHRQLLPLQDPRPTTLPFRLLPAGPNASAYFVHSARL